MPWIESSKKPHAGFSLLEVLIALLIVAGGLLAIIQFQSMLFRNSAVSKQRSEAVLLAQERIEELRAYANQTGYDALANVDGTANDSAAGIFGPSSGESIAKEATTFTRMTYITKYTAPSVYSDVQVTVTWTTASNEQESINLNTAIAWVNPANSGTLIAGTSSSNSTDCSAQSVTDSVCSGSSVAATNGSSQTITYSAGGVGSGVWLCTNGALTKTSGTCSANCAATTVSDDTCSGLAAATSHGANASVTYSAGGTGSGVFACNNGAFSKVSGTCTPLACTTPWGSTLSSGQSVTAYSSSAPTVACSSASETRTCTDGVLSGSYTNQTCSNPCTGTPWGTMASGNSNTAYSAASATNCAAISETRTCTNGTLSGSYTFTSCTISGGNSCTTPWNTTVASGSSVTAYQSASAASCTSETRTCNNGTLDGSYQYQSCNSNPCTLSQTITYGSSQFCETSNNSGVPSGSFTSGSSCTISSNSKTITCTKGSITVGSSVTLSAVPQEKSGSSCTNRTLTCTTSSPTSGLSTFTCSNAAVAWTATCQ